MKILILGATGRTGKELLDQALKAGISVHVLVRNTDKVKITARNLKLFESKTLDKTALRLAMQGCDAVLSTLICFPLEQFKIAEKLLIKHLTKCARDRQRAGH